MARLLVSLFLLFIFSTPSWATTWYLRPSGGSLYGTSNGTNKCNGQTNVDYSLGVSPNCAISDPGQILGFGCGNFGTGTCGVSRQIAGGDTIYFLGDNGSSQAVYNVGYNGVSNSDCNTSFEYDCTWGNIPAGTAGTPTQLIGTGNHKAKIVGIGSTVPWQLLNINNDYIDITNLEIAETGNCTYNNPVASCHSSDGIETGGTGQIWTNVYIHGVSRYGVVTETLGSATYTNLWIIGSGYGGFTVGNNDTSSVTGTLTFNQPIIEWSGCAESSTTGGIDNPSNYNNCFGQSTGGYGDGLAFGPTGNQNAGNWSLYGPGSISWNTQDGLDTLHGSGNGAIQVDKMRFEGNAGNQVKINAITTSLTNSLVVGDCGWWYGSSQAASGSMLTGDVCRALGDTFIFNVTNNSNTYIYNNTFIGNGNIELETKDENSTGCNQSGGSGTQIYARNNIVVGGYAWWDDTTWNGAGGNSFTTYIYNAGNNGNSGGTCGALTWNEDYNLVSWSAGQCVGAHDKCNTSPSFIAGNFPVGTSGGAANTYYQAWSGITLLPISNSSAAKGAGGTGLSYWNTGNDYYNTTRSNPPSIGGLEYNSSAANGYLCFFNSDCSSGTCTANACVGSGGGGSLNMNISGAFSLIGASNY